jgi:hypothetical protein
MDSKKFKVRYTTKSKRQTDLAIPVNNKPIRRHSVVQFESLLGGCDGRQDRETVDSGFDVRGCAVLVCKHFADLGDLVSRLDCLFII